MDEHLPLRVLTKIELRETELLAWGAVGAQWSEQEMQELLTAEGADRTVLDFLLAKNLVVVTPSGGYRSRSAETIRLMATLRQSFRGRPVTTGRSLVLDFRFLHRPRRRPKRDVEAAAVLHDMSPMLRAAGMAAAQTLMPPLLSGFQRRSASEVLTALSSADPSGVMVTSGTGSGKTLAFYLPLLAWMSDQATAGRRGPSGPLVLALYPRNELLKDQLKTLLGYLAAVNRTAAGGRKLSIATWYGQTPTSAEYVRKNWVDGWTRTASKSGYVCPFARCPDCGNEMEWPVADLTAKPPRERLRCSDVGCGGEIDGSLLRLTRESARNSPADLMLTTTESLNRQLSTPGNLPAFGLGYQGSVRAVLLDEVHIYEGTTGAQNAILLRRLRYNLGRTPVWVGLSATLSKADEFFGRLVDLPGNAVTVVQPRYDELEESGAEYLVALRHNPFSETGPLSATIQTCMVLARSLDRVDDDPFAVVPSSDNVFASRVFVFTDKLDSTNRLYWDLMDAEGHETPKYLKRRKPVTLAHLRSEKQGRVDNDDRESAHDRDPDGQWWWLADKLGHGVEDDLSLVVGRTSSQDRGVTSDAQVVVATATLEVGFDDDRVGAVVQHKAPRDAAQFLQRKGRAGRDTKTRPWTVVVLSDWGRDRQAWDGYDALFDPELPPRSLPVGNIYVLRIQAVYALMDWLAAEMGYTGRDSVWTDLAGPAQSLFPDNQPSQDATSRRQQTLSEKLAQLLRPGPERTRLRRHIRDALGLGSGEIADSLVDTLFWEAPRPLLLAVVPVIRRRLQQQWSGEEPLADDLGLRTRTPMREFVPGNLFNDLLVPDVELRVPVQRQRFVTEHLPALRALREFSPGNVSRHFGIYATNKRHWVPLPAASPGEDARVDVTSTYRAEFLETIYVGGRSVVVYYPRSVQLADVPDDIRDASSMRPEWQFHALPLGEGSLVGLPRAVLGVVARADTHLHLHGGGARIIRFAQAARGTLWDRARRNVRLEYGTGGGRDWVPAAIGVEVQCDAMEFVVRRPDAIGPPTPTERTARLRHLITFEADLPEDMSYFDRDRLFQVLLLAVAASADRAEDVPAEMLTPHALTEAAAVLGVLDEQHEHAQGKTQWREWFSDTDVVSTLHAAVDDVRAESRSDAWTTWWQRTYTYSAAAIVLSALSALCPGVDAEDIAVDLSPDDDLRFWFSEQSPGGTGQIEAFTRALNDDPDGFARAVEDSLAPSAVETLDDELTALIRSTAPEVREALEGLRDAWHAGHDTVAAAVRSVDDAARLHGIILGGPARSAVSTRIAGPGAHGGLIDEVAHWLALRDGVTARTGLQVDPRTLGGLLAGCGELDAILHLGDAGTPEKRARAVANVLWPWGHARSSSSAGDGLQVFMPAIRAHIHLGPKTVDVDSWDDACRIRVHEALVEHGEVVLRTPLQHTANLRTVLLDLQTQPVEVGALLCHPIVVGVRRATGMAEARLLLREAP
ncbi:Lhr-like helicase [Actinokineospora spheciospongiae]|uniref:Lhr-like helicase n=1 Tax=Actinokineospora spheciospongiae TaxID=909613 RepID=W7JDM8_9PSEU|nr:protein DpdJ [Actinokineospora spheciospongiae]EWC64099.1 Lhr-like helicase [Actinokineospora spheciospongiae]